MPEEQTSETEPKETNQEASSENEVTDVVDSPPSNDPSDKDPTTDLAKLSDDGLLAALRLNLNPPAGTSAPTELQSLLCHEAGERTAPEILTFMANHQA